MVSRDHPIHVSHRKWFSLALSVLLLGLFVIFSIVVVGSGSTGDPVIISVNLLILYGLLAVIAISGVVLLMAFLKSRKIEFFDTYMRIVPFAGGEGKDVSYSKIKISNLKIRMIRGLITYHFKVSSAKTLGYDFQFDLNNERIRSLNTNLYSWLQNKTN